MILRLSLQRHGLHVALAESPWNPPLHLRFDAWPRLGTDQTVIEMDSATRRALVAHQTQNGTTMMAFELRLQEYVQAHAKAHLNNYLNAYLLSLHQDRQPLPDEPLPTGEQLFETLHTFERAFFREFRQLEQTRHRRPPGLAPQYFARDEDLALVAMSGIRRRDREILLARYADPVVIQQRYGIMRQNLIGVFLWRTSKTVYRFDPDVEQALLDTPLTGAVSTWPLTFLPQWGLYLELQAEHFLEVGGLTLRGAYVWVSEQGPDEPPLLNFALDGGFAFNLIPVNVPLLPTVEACRQAMLRRGEVLVSGTATQLALQQAQDIVARACLPLLNLLLYLQTEGADVQPGEVYTPPSAPGAGTRRSGKGNQNIQVLEVGQRLGAALRLGTQEREQALAWQRQCQDDGLTVLVPPCPGAHWAAPSAESGRPVWSLPIAAAITGQPGANEGQWRTLPFPTRTGAAGPVPVRPAALGSARPPSARAALSLAWPDEPEPCDSVPVTRS